MCVFVYLDVFLPGLLEYWNTIIITAATDWLAALSSPIPGFLAEN